MILIKLNQHVNEMITTAGKKFKDLLLSYFLIIVQNVTWSPMGNVAVG